MPSGVVTSACSTQVPAAATAPVAVNVGALTVLPVSAPQPEPLAVSVIAEAAGNVTVAVTDSPDAGDRLEAVTTDGPSLPAMANSPVGPTLTANCRENVVLPPSLAAVMV